MLEDPWVAPPEDAFVLTVAVDRARAGRGRVGFEQACRSRSTARSWLHELIAALNRLAGAYGVGRIDMIENRAVGIKSRELYEAPAAIALIEAHEALEDVVLTKAEASAKRELEPKWAKLVYDGLWFRPVREALRRVLRGDAGARHGRGARSRSRPGAAVVDRPALRARALRRDARVVRHRRDVPARGRRGVHPDRRARGRARAARERRLTLV